MDQFWMDFHLKIVGSRKAAKAIIHYKNIIVSVFIVFKIDIASNPLGGLVWTPEWPPFGLLNPNNKIPKAGQERFLAVPRGQRRPQEGPKNGPQKTSAKMDLIMDPKKPAPFGTTGSGARGGGRRRGKPFLGGLEGGILARFTPKPPVAQRAGGIKIHMV